MSRGSGPREHYREARQEAVREAGILGRRAGWVSHFRTVAFLLTAAPLLLLETTDRGLWPLLLGWAVVAALVFFLLVRRHRRLRRELHRWEIRRMMGEEGEARLERAWDRLPPSPLAEANEDHPAAWDLDLVGRASLAHLTSRATTGPGRALLRSWILDPLAPAPDDASRLLGRRGDRYGRALPTGVPAADWWERVRARQAAVRVLARHTELREALELAGREVEGAERPGDALAFLRWAASAPWLRDRGSVLGAGIVLGVVTPISTVGWFLGWVPGIVPLLGGAASLVLHRIVGPEAARRLDAAEGGEGAVERWSNLLLRIEELPDTDEAPPLGRLGEAVRTPAQGAARSLTTLRRIVDTAGVRRSSLAHFPLVVLFSWDVHMLAWLERWQARHGGFAERWVLALAEVEALCSLAGLVHDHPGWAFPTFSREEGVGISARALGHPLLPPDRCVPNEVEVPPAGQLLLITGSNMAGKTTLLRALGTNQILALAGGPVAAREFGTRPVLPWTAMRVRDSLVGGVSYFLAELQRLRKLVDAARSGPILFLLDEILQGTNTAERRTAARIVLDHLLRTDAVGAVTTHDLTLADSPELGSRLVQVHFRENVHEVDGRKELDFDYLLRPGPATSRNALLLLELVGLGPEKGGGGPG